jgi:hypothetical protein
MTTNSVSDATPEPWFCDAHRLWTTSDCPKCDDELIALTEDWDA